MFSRIIGKSIIGTKFLKKTFFFYLVAAFMFTLIQIVQQYLNEQERIERDLIQGKIAFQDSLTKAVWHLDEKLLNKIANGILESKTFDGIFVKNLEGQILWLGGIVSPDVFDEESSSEKFKVSVTDFILSEKFALQMTVNNEKERIGEAHFFVKKSEILRKMKGAVFLIFTLALLKSLLLWIITYYFFIKFINRPLERIQSRLKELDVKSDQGGIKIENMLDEDFIRSEVHNIPGSEISNLAHGISRTVSSLVEKSDRQREEIEVRMQEELKDRLFDAFPDHIVKTDESGNVLSCHLSSFNPVTGLMVGSNLFKIFPEWELMVGSDTLSQFFKNNQENELVFLFENSGEKFYFEIILVQNQQQVNLLLLRDITGKIRVKNALLKETVSWLQKD